MRMNRRLRIFDINCRFPAGPLGLVYNYAREISSRRQRQSITLSEGLYERKKGLGMEKDDMSRQAAVNES